MESGTGAADKTAKRSAVTPLGVVLGVVFVLFCGILIFVWVATKRAHPVMLDQQGRPVEQSAPSGGSK